MSVNITGIKELEKLLLEAGKAPARALTASAKKGANIVRNDAKANAPKDTGLLRRSIKLKAEKRKVGKKVYQIGFYGEGLVKISKDGKRSFYPASQEYGWVDKSGKRHPGKRFLRNASEKNRALANETMINELASQLKNLR